MTVGTTTQARHALGATVIDGGVAFALHSANATRVELLLFDSADADRPSRNIDLERGSGSAVWRTFVPDLGPGQIYGYRVRGPFAPTRGHHFHSRKLLLDPHAKSIAGLDNYNRLAAGHPSSNFATSLKSVVVGNGYDWRGDVKPATPWRDTVIYEMHVGGFTKHESSGVASGKRGTFAGLIEKIPYLQDLGVTAVELLPIHFFDPDDAPRGLTNYWGYSTIGFFAPHAGLATATEPLAVVDEFRDMVRTLHSAGIEVILDVVYNHTAEGSVAGPTLNLRGIDNEAYYHLDRYGRYRDFSGCGNSLDASKVATMGLILDSLRYWADEMHVDGFRFDLASILCRGTDGEQLVRPPLIGAIDADPVLRGTKLIAEGWDAKGLYQVGSFPSRHFADWNGPFRDDVRRLVKGDSGVTMTVAKRLSGSDDLYRDARPPCERSINYITCHDGFTLADLVSYDRKHNEANGEHNRDGSDNNYSWNCGVEGPTDEAPILDLRRRQARNLLTLLMLADGCPMLLMGDEVLRSQSGNNNAYCQDNESTWLDWDDIEANDDMYTFVRNLIALARGRDGRRWNARGHAESGDERADARFFTPHLEALNGDAASSTLTGLWEDPHSGEKLCLLINAEWERIDFKLPGANEGFVWRRVVDTADPDGRHFVSVSDAPELETAILTVEGRSITALVSAPDS